MSHLTSIISLFGRDILIGVGLFFLTMFLSSIYTKKLHPGTALTIAFASVLTAAIFFPNTPLETRTTKQQPSPDTEVSQSLAKPSTHPSRATDSILLTNNTEPVTNNDENTPFPSRTSPAPPPITANPAKPLEKSLLAMNHVEVDTNLDIDLKLRDSLQVNAETTGEALIYSCSGSCQGSSPQTRQFVLGQKYSRLHARLFVLDSSADNHRLEFWNDNTLIQEYTVLPGQPTIVDLDVSNVARLTVLFHAPHPLRTGVQYGLDLVSGDSGGELPGVALVEPRLFQD